MAACFFILHAEPRTRVICQSRLRVNPDFWQTFTNPALVWIRAQGLKFSHAHRSGWCLLNSWLALWCGSLLPFHSSFGICSPTFSLFLKLLLLFMKHFLVQPSVFLELLRDDCSYGWNGVFTSSFLFCILNLGCWSWIHGASLASKSVVIVKYL